MEFFETNELGLISALVFNGYSPIERKREGKIVKFVFENSDSVQQIKNDYFNNRLILTDAMGYFSTIKSVKTSIFRMED